MKDTESLGTKVQKRTGESVVYLDEESGHVFKVKDPYAKSAMKRVWASGSSYDDTEIQAKLAELSAENI